MAKSTTTKRTSKPTEGVTHKDAVTLLKADHDEVDALFKEFESIKDEADPEELGDIVRKVCAVLSMHARIEEEIFYPAIGDAVGDDAEDLLNEAEVEHGILKDLIARLEQMDPDDEMYVANVTVLAEYVKHHVKEEEGELFPKARKSDLDLAALGEELTTRKEELEVRAAG